MEDLLSMSLRTLAAYAVVFVAMRIMGKREIGKLSIFDLVISIMIAEIAVIVIENVDEPLAKGVVPIFLLVGIQLLLAWLSLKSRAFRIKMDGQPSVLIRNGKVDREEMRKQRYNLDDLLTQLRERNITNLADVEFALLESTGKLTVVEKAEYEKERRKPSASSAPPSVSPASSSAPAGVREVRYEGLPIPLIMDGKVQDKNLEEIGQTRFWLKKQLRERGIDDFKDVFICTYDHKGNFYIDKK
jgi:uncharacterized membrane protein YcaP (DUF421 family)